MRPFPTSLFCSYVISIPLSSTRWRANRVLVIVLVEFLVSVLSPRGCACRVPDFGTVVVVVLVECLVSVLSSYTPKHTDGQTKAGFTGGISGVGADRLMICNTSWVNGRSAEFGWLQASPKSNNLSASSLWYSSPSLGSTASRILSLA